MHKLERSSAPECLSQYSPEKDRWKSVTPENRAQIREQLNAMQQQRCAYCENSTAGNNAQHIEHFRQRSEYPQGTFEWKNLFGSCNRNHSCGKHKDSLAGQYNYQDIIKPDEEDPDHFFCFTQHGTIEIRQHLSERDRHRASETLRIFNLDAQHGPLRSMRKSTLQGYLQTAEEFAAMAEQFEEKEWRPLLEEELYRIKDLPFATAIKHLLMV
ncbi:MAG: retron Ec78 anti-phage system effector HNH endonuclease PtuB [Chlorobium sp.]